MSAIKICVICKRQVIRPAYTLTVADHADDGGDFQSHPIHGTCLTRLWEWASTQQRTRASTEALNVPERDAEIVQD